MARVKVYSSEIVPKGTMLFSIFWAPQDGFLDFFRKNKKIRSSFNAFFYFSRTYIYSEGPFLHPLLQIPFIARFLLVRKSKKGTLTDFRRKNYENFGLCLFYLGHFSAKERNICLLLIVLSKFLYSNKQNSIQAITVL